MRVGDKHFVQEQGDLVCILPNEVHASLGAVDDTMMEYVCVHLEVTDPWFRQQLSQIGQIVHPSGSKMESLLRPILMDLAQIKNVRKPFALTSKNSMF
jgi:hypothetical protein